MIWSNLVGHPRFVVHPSIFQIRQIGSAKVQQQTRKFRSKTALEVYQQRDFLTSWQGESGYKFWSFPNTTGGYGDMIIIGASALAIASIYAEASPEKEEEGA